uniref:Uncharacterized protein n=1 Tax=Amphimedon queenslandica TaxID=400682 RepID=A0A1X7SEM6_AMPQE
MAAFITHELVPSEQADMASKHETKSVTSAEESIKAQIKSDFECLLKHLKSFQSHLEKFFKAEGHISYYPHKLRRFITENVKNTEHKDKLLKEVDTHYSKYSKALSAEKNSPKAAVSKF